ncbi:MAG: SDR family oxidoreductase [Bacteroidota bacterium]
MKDKIVIITGASSGIGRACAIAFSDAGAKVVLAARDLNKLAEIELILKNKGREVLVVVTDVSKEEDCKQMIETTVSHFGKIDVLINNAGLSMRALFLDLDLKVLKHLMDVNFWGTVYCTKFALPYLLSVKGMVVGVSSIAGKKGLPARTGYSASKFAMEGFLETLRIENLKTGLNVLVVSPGYTASNIRNTALSKDGSEQGDSPLDEVNLMSSEEVAKHILKGVMNRKRDIILTFTGKVTVFLNKFFPSFMDKMVFNHIKNESGSPLK